MHLKRLVRLCLRWIKFVPVQVIKTVFTLVFQDGKETANTAMRGQKSSLSLDGHETAVEEVGSKKAETGSGFLLNQPAGVHQEEQPVAAQRYVFCFALFCI